MGQMSQETGEGLEAIGERLWVVGYKSGGKKGGIREEGKS
jgi:hypothetical protein